VSFTIYLYAYKNTKQQHVIIPEDNQMTHNPAVITILCSYKITVKVQELLNSLYAYRMFIVTNDIKLNYLTETSMHIFCGNINVNY